MSLIQTIILAIIEGVTEFLPISSTGHMILASKILGISSTEFTKSFEIIIQLGAIGAVFFLYIKKFIENPKIIKPLLFSFIPTAIVGLILYKIIKQFLLGNPYVTVGALFFGGIVLLFVDKVIKPKAEKKEIATLSPTNAVIIGLCQSLSVVPGVSRAAATIIGGMSVGMGKVEAVEYSFLLALPTMAAATALDLVKTGFSFAFSEWMLILVGMAVSFITALVTIRNFLSYIKHSSFFGFGIYRILIAVSYFFLVG
ncbi:undecaprenyl-diphosphate phosphatase [Candidatus Gottesmanbacteria bacterium]|nr:undecaprenyl-diphosphate phosphatase [Candidatus Gottesmanbacteria bacterium]